MQKAQELKPAGVSRRTALKAFGTGIGTVAALPWLSDEGLLAFARIQENNAPPQPKVFSPSQFATLELLVDAMIPTDDRSPGAKQATVRGYYTSKIGIHDELHYKGNVFLKEFVGCQTEDGKDCPICGQRRA